MLKKFIRHYWYVSGEERKSSNNKLLLPMDHVDLIINMGNPFIYLRNHQICELESIHFHGIRQSSLNIIESGKIQALGISFTPWGFYFFTKQSMNKYVNKIVNLSYVNYLLYQDLFDCMIQFCQPLKFIKLLETSFIKYVKVSEREEIDCNLIKKFLQCNCFNIKDYCEVNEIPIRRLERIFTKYIGVSPKKFMDIVRFEQCARDIIYNNESRLTDISYKYGYYDQPHFVKVFKGYTYYAPREFQLHKPALKSYLYHK